MNQEMTAAIEQFSFAHLEFQKAENELCFHVHQFMCSKDASGRKRNLTQLRALADQLPICSLARKNVYQKIYALQEEQQKQIQIQTQLRSCEQS